jgi:hypothetical protein
MMWPGRIVRAGWLGPVVLAWVGSAAGQEAATASQAPARPAARAADSDAPLPEGFPGATAPDQIEVKVYPAYRSAVAKGEGMTAASGDLLFWVLFNHIQKQDVAMTSPVINTYPDPAMMAEPGKRGEVTMEFLYRNQGVGETGRDTAVVEVVDHAPQAYVCLGLQGPMTPERLAEANRRLTAWLEAHGSEYRASGPPRRLGYHGPMTPVEQRLWEVQIPVKQVAE